MLEKIISQFNPATGEIAGVPAVERHLSDLRGCFADRSAYEAAIAVDDRLVYTVARVTPADGDGDLHCGLGRLMPGKIGSEYFMTKGHLHAWRAAAEFYFGLSGEGAVLLEDETTGESRMAELKPGTAVYVPGRTAHRTVNTGGAPLVYLGVYPSQAGHDYDAIAKNNFRCVIVERDGRPVMLDRRKT
jgi:glucose-6-phosphate isomerase